MEVSWKLLANEGWLINEEAFHGRVAVGDILDTNHKVYVVDAINEDGIVVRELK